jgi:FMN-dependent NADH-azoreductase
MARSILKIDTSIREQGSYSRDLSSRLVNQLLDNQDCLVTSRNLSDGIPLIDENWVISNTTPATQRSLEQRDCLKISDTLIEELNKADFIVIGLPIYNFNVPAVFKAWVDQIVRANVTFRYTDNGPIGLVRNKKVYIIIVSGGTRLGTELDFVSGYLTHILGFIGMTDVSIIDSSAIGRSESQVLSKTYKYIDSI